MKKTLEFISILATVFFAASCSKNADVENNQQGEQTDAVKCKIIFDENTKVTFTSEGKFTWNSGDKIAVFQDGYYATDHQRNADQNTFTTEDAGNPAVFDGSIKGWQPKGEGGTPNVFYIVYPQFTSTLIKHYIKNQKTIMAVPSTQTGVKNAAARNCHFITGIAEDDFVSYEKGELIIRGSGTLTATTPLFKFNLPEEYQATKIEITGTDAKGNVAGLAGTYQFNLTMGTDDFWVTTDQSKANCMATTLTIENEGNVLSGDLYAVMAPNCYSYSETADGSKIIKNLENNIKTISFTIYNAEGGSLVFTKTLKGDNFKNGTIKDLGTLPTGKGYRTPVPGELTLLETPLTVGGVTERTAASIKNAPTTGCTFYYTTDGSEPTTSSNTFDVATGFSVDSQWDNPFSKYTVKVLIHTTDTQYEDKIVEGLVRNFPLNRRTLIMNNNAKMGDDDPSSPDVYGGTNAAKPFQWDGNRDNVLIKVAGTYYTIEPVDDKQKAPGLSMKIYSNGNNTDELFSKGKLNNSYIYQDYARILFSVQVMADSKVTGMIRFGSKYANKDLNVKFWHGFQTNRKADGDITAVTRFSKNYESEFQSKVVSFGDKKSEDYVTFFSENSVLQKFTILEAYEKTPALTNTEKVGSVVELN